MTVGDNVLRFAYDASGLTRTVTWNDTVYYYATNLQGDIIAILDADGNAVVEYTYDAWGNIYTISGTKSITLGRYNPLRYRGYVYDTETELYYLQSRYYNPEIGRFINADAYISTGQSFIGDNMFAYCLNNPINFVDRDGKNAEAIQWWVSTMWVLCVADLQLPVGEIVYVVGIVVLGCVALSPPQDRDSAIVFDDDDTAYGSPSPNNYNDDDDDDDYDDDYYDDDSNFGGREKIGVNRGNAPRSNQAQNAQTRSIFVEKHLSHKKNSLLHKAIQRQGYGYWDIVEELETLEGIK